ncbi:multiple sugar transport system permease protein [Anaerobacterium chartisolvens]|uniref:Multiple sugar transport system permease protein n=1 Tax=Anaerobacterium chartisolvens TaxID=1297424 RepID=A0A369AYR2_9FIRM|nr:multiple sugar transport system permease protein [Anaerobacterium chartisolvens]
MFNAIAVPLIVIFSFSFALLLNRQIKGLAFFRSFFILPLVIPVASVILVWNIMFNEYGVVNGILSNFNLQPVDWLRSDWSMAVLIILYLWKNCGYNMILFAAGLNSIPKEYYESARIDGAGWYTCLSKITIPFLIPTGFFVVMISVINSFKIFREAYLLAGSYPSLRIYMLQHFMNNNFFNLSYQRLTTAAFIMSVGIALLVLVLFKIEARFGRNI